MKRIAILFSLLLLIVCFAACKNNDVYLSESDSSAPADTSSGFGIIITDKQETASGAESKTSSTAPTQSEIAEIASDWDEVEVEIEVVKPSSKTDTTTSDSSVSSKETNTSSEEKTPASSSSVATSSEEASSEQSSEESSSKEEPSSSKVTSLPEYYEGRY